MDKNQENNSWAPEVMVSGETKWLRNSLRFATKAEALASADELMMRWFSVTDERAVPTSDPVNYTFRDGKNISLEV